MSAEKNMKRQRQFQLCSMILVSVLLTVQTVSASISPWKGDGSGRYLFGTYKVPSLPKFGRKIGSRDQTSSAENLDTDLIMFTGDNCAHCKSTSFHAVLFLFIFLQLWFKIASYCGDVFLSPTRR